ncbi:MAG: NapC/NirT family cytochrome c [Coriobacteriia bacterium]|nr:NapC/NirT family cytochrome c [Coriobacteriia bacterium]
MPRISLSGFTDPARRPRYIIWTGALVLGFAAFVVVAMGVTSTRWFCSNACHKVQDDTIIAYGRSTHSNVSCMACHMPVNADPITFTLHKAKALGELYLTVTNRYELPLNPGSHLAMDGEHMPSEQCTQCHSMGTRRVTPTKGIIIDHDAHIEEGVTCTTCHNRVAHKEDFELTLKDPRSGEPNRKHPDFMKMDSCFRCHSQADAERPPGDCLACHPKDFELKPANHDPANFVRDPGEGRAVHAVMGAEDAARVASATADAHGEEVRPAVSERDGEGLDILPLSEVSYCGTCHDKQEFCNDCHGVEMPHPAGFEKGHGEAGKKSPDVCANCHTSEGRVTATSTEFCNACHHKDGDPTKPWIPQHFVPVRAKGASACFDCHDPVFCARCHVRGIQ